VARPMFHIPYKGSSLYKTLCDVFYSHAVDLNAISFDSIPRADLQEVFAELGSTAEPGHSRPYRIGATDDDYWRWHYDLWRTGQTKVAVTCMYNVKVKLQQLGVPVFRVLPAKSAVESALNMMLRVAEMQVVRDAQIAVQMFELDTLTGSAEYRSADEMHNSEIKLTQKLIAYAAKVQGSLKSAGPGRFVIFTTRGMLRASTNDFTRIPDLEEYEQIGKDLVTGGIGIGMSAYEAEFHAAKALLHARKYGKGSWVVFLDDKTVVGPLGKTEQLTYAYASDRLQSISAQTTISIATLSKIAAIMQKTRRAEMSAHELAQHMQIVPRSGRRIMQKLEEKGYAVVTGEENPNPRGRPRQIYRIDLGQE
jgi:hypothetical protein